MACAIVFTFITLNLPRIIATANEIRNLDIIIFCIEKKRDYIGSLLAFQFDLVARTCMIINSSVNFIIYCAMSSAFKVKQSRAALHYYLSTPRLIALSLQKVFCETFCFDCPGCLKNLFSRQSENEETDQDQNQGESQSPNRLTSKVTSV